MFGNECRGIPSSSGDALTATPLDCHEERGRHGSILPPVMAHQQVERTTGRDETMVFSEGPPSLWRCAAILPRAQEMQFSLVSGQIWSPKVSKRRVESPLGHTPPRGLTRRLRRWWWGCRPEGGSTFFRRERKYQRKHAARRLQRRPTSLCTATKPCAALGLGYALHGFQPFLALVGLRPPLAVGFGLREPNGWTTRINSGRPIPA